MGCAEIISLSEVRARKQWTTLRQRLHERFDQWLDTLEQRMHEPHPTLADVTDAVWELRHSLTGSLTETIIAHTSTAHQAQQHACCPQCARSRTARGLVSRTLETMVGPVHVHRPYLYCAPCHQGFYPLDEVLELATGHKQYDVQQAAAKLVAEVPYETAHLLFRELTGVALGTERMHTLTNQLAEGLSVVDMAPTPEEVAWKISAVAPGHQQPIMVLAIDGAHVPTRPESARACSSERKRYRAQRAHWRGQWREAKGFRCYLLDSDRIVHLLSWHQVQDDHTLAKALRQVKEAGLLHEDQVRLCVVADGAPWIWKHVPELFPSAEHILDYYHCAEHVHALAKQQYGESLHAVEWAEATITRLFCGQVAHVIGGLKRMQPASATVAHAIAKLATYLDGHRTRLNYEARRRAGYPLGSGGIESANKFICHVRLKRSGAWWYEANSHQLMALRCAKYNGTFARVFTRYRQRLQHVKK